MNETLRVIAERYSCRGYDGAPVDKALLDAIALAAVQAPSGMNLQPWKVIVINNKDFVDELDAEGMRILAAAADKSAYERMMSRGGKLFYNAPCMFLIVRQPDTELDTGIITENIALAATSLGLGNIICGMAAMPFNGEKGGEFKGRAGVPEGWEFGMTVLVGHANVTKEPHEPDMSKVSFVE